MFRGSICFITAAILLSACEISNYLETDEPSEASVTGLNPKAPSHGLSSTGIDYGDWATWNSTFDEDALVEERFSSSVLSLFEEQGSAALKVALTADGFVCDALSEGQVHLPATECKNIAYEESPNDKITAWSWRVTLLGNEVKAQYRREVQFIHILLNPNG